MVVQALITAGSAVGIVCVGGGAGALLEDLLEDKLAKNFRTKPELMCDMVAGCTTSYCAPLIGLEGYIKAMPVIPVEIPGVQINPFQEYKDKLLLALKLCKRFRSLVCAACGKCLKATVRRRTLKMFAC